MYDMAKLTSWSRESESEGVVYVLRSKCSDEKRGESGVAFFGLAFVL
jgi:hypothetical protein